MEQMNDYKQDIAATRVGCLGSSDGKLIAQVAALKEVPKSAYKRLAIVKGLIPQVEIPKTAAIQAGDDLEMLLFDHLRSQDPRWESNPYWESKKYSKPNCKLISHPDLVLKDDARKVLKVYEVKTTKFTYEQTRSTYASQIFIHYLLGKEIADTFGKDWTVEVYLVHYSTDGLDLEQGVTLDPSRLTIKQVAMRKDEIDVNAAMVLINAFLDTFTEYYEGDEVDADLLPAAVKTQFEDVAAMLVEINDRQKKVDEFKQRLYQFMSERGIKSVKNDMFTITCVAPSVTKSFDAKAYMADMQKSHPRKAKKILEEYSKTTNKKGYALIKVKEQKDK